MTAPAADLGERLRTRAALTASPATPCTAAEVAFVFGLELEAVEAVRPGDELAPTWRAWLAALGHRGGADTANRPPGDRPLTTWTAIAEAVGVCTETLKRARDKHAPKQRAYFDTVSAARTWYAGLGAPRPRTPALRTKPGRPVDPEWGKPYDAAAARKRLREG